MNMILSDVFQSFFIQRKLIALNAVIPQNMRHRFTSFRLYEMHKLIPAFQFTSQFSLTQAPSSRKPILPVGKQWEIHFRFMSLRLTSSFGGMN
jgi:hypothetical protein